MLRVGVCGPAQQWQTLLQAVKGIYNGIWGTAYYNLVITNPGMFQRNAFPGIPSLGPDLNYLFVYALGEASKQAEIVIESAVLLKDDNWTQWVIRTPVIMGKRPIPHQVRQIYVAYLVM